MLQQRSEKFDRRRRRDRGEPRPSHRTHLVECPIRQRLSNRSSIHCHQRSRRRTARGKAYIPGSNDIVTIVTPQSLIPLLHVLRAYTMAHDEERVESEGGVDDDLHVDRPSVSILSLCVDGAGKASRKYGAMLMAMVTVFTWPGRASAVQWLQLMLLNR